MVQKIHEMLKKIKYKLFSFFSYISKIFFIAFYSIAPVFAGNQTVIAITEIVQHQSLEQAKTGILDVLTENGYVAGKNLKLVQQNAQGSVANAAVIAKNFINLVPDAIVSISTPSTQAVFNVAKFTKIPVIFSSVTDPVAAGLINDINSVDEYFTGAIDYPPADEVIELIESLVPNVKKLGFLYNSGEANSVKTLELMKNALDNQWQIIEAIAPNSANAGQALYSLIGKVDAVYIPSDNTIFASLPMLVQISRKHNIPIFSSDPDSVKIGVLACAGYTQYEVGRTAGRLLVRKLQGEKAVKIEKPKNIKIFVNKASANILGIKIVDNILGNEVQIIE